MKRRAFRTMRTLVTKVGRSLAVIKGALCGQAKNYSKAFTKVHNTYSTGFSVNDTETSDICRLFYNNFLTLKLLHYKYTCEGRYQTLFHVATSPLHQRQAQQ